MDASVHIVGAIHRGVVAEFSGDSGLGTVREDSGQHYPFHCTAIADGSRQIDDATAVDFVLGFGRLGRIEATLVTPIDSTD